MNRDEIIEKVKNTVILASTTYSPDQKEAFQRAIQNETTPNAKFTLENLLENAKLAELNNNPLCDDTGIPHLFIEIGGKQMLSGEMIEAIHEGVAEGLRELPGRPMAVKGDDIQRIEQSLGLFEDPGAMIPAPIVMKPMKEEGIKLSVLMQGGGPEIRGRTYRVFHKRKIENVLDEVIGWAKDDASLLGCTPCIPAIGIGRTHYEANALMLEAMIYGRFDQQSELEKRVTNSLNEINVGPLGLRGDTTALASFIKIGPQRASGVRIVALRLNCTVEPRVASVWL